ncbi:MAG TPA: TonB family protein [Kofleriaceae bacterium]|nr:TonB family protein [Kofleriaceae bacterium]
MFTKLHLLSQDTPEGGGGLSWRKHPYLCMVGGELKGPVVFDWSERQRKDLEALWRDPASDGARMRLGGDLAAFGGKLGWSPDAEELEKAEASGEEYMVTISAAPPELYVLPWEVTHVGAGRTHLSNFASAQVRYAVPGLEPRELQPAPPRPGVLFAWSEAGGTVPHDDQVAAIRAAADRGGVEVEELAGVDAGKLQAALDAGPPSVLHLLCHGLPGPPGEPSRLVWGADIDRRSEITATALADMLRRHHDAIRLVVLSACGSGDGRGDPLFMTSIAQELHRKGIPNVVASRYPLSVSGSRVLTRALYGKMLDEAWSMERALRHARAELFRVDEDGESHPGDAYGLQLYAHDTERFRSDNDAFAERPVLASYPFGTPARPVPAKEPPPAELTLDLEARPELSAEQLADKLRSVSEDDRLTIAIRTGKGKGAVSLIVHTTVDGAQRLLGVRRSKVLQIVVGVAVVQLILTKGIKLAGAATPHAAAHQPGAGASPHGAAPAGHGASAAGKAAGAAGRAGARSAARALASIAGRAVTAKLTAAILIGGAAAVSGVTMYRAQHEADASVAMSPVDAGLGAPGPGENAIADGEGSGSAAAFQGLSGDDGRSGGEGRSGSGGRTTSVGSPTSSEKPPERANDGSGDDRRSGGRSGPGGRTTSAGSATTREKPPEHASDGSGGRTHRAEERESGQQTPRSDADPSEHEDVPASEQATGSGSGTGEVEVAPTVLQAFRRSGDPAPLPDRATISLMRHDHVLSVEGVVRLCITTTGDVAEAKVLQSTGYPSYDDRLLAAVRDWRYQPPMIRGTPVLTCSTVRFNYSSE